MKISVIGDPTFCDSDKIIKELNLLCIKSHTHSISSFPSTLFSDIVFAYCIDKNIHYSSLINIRDCIYDQNISTETHYTNFSDKTNHIGTSSYTVSVKTNDIDTSFDNVSVKTNNSDNNIDTVYENNVSVKTNNSDNNIDTVYENNVSVKTNNSDNNIDTVYENVKIENSIKPLPIKESFNTNISMDILESDILILFCSNKNDYSSILKLMRNKRTPIYIITTIPSYVVKLKKTNEKIIQNCDIYIGRKYDLGGWYMEQSKWHNPYSSKQYGLEKSLKMFENYLTQNPDLMFSLLDLKYGVLGCWCKPQQCHGDILLKHLDNMLSGSSFFVSSEYCDDFLVTYTMCGDSSSIQYKLDEFFFQFSPRCYNTIIVSDISYYSVRHVIIQRKKLFLQALTCNYQSESSFYTSS